PTLEITRTLNDKWRFSDFARARDIPVAETILIDHKEQFDFSQAQSVLGLPIVIKPTNQQRSRGMHVISSIDEYDRKIRYDSAYTFVPLVSQKFIPVIDISISILAIDGIVLHYAIQTKDERGVVFVDNRELFEAATRLVNIAQYNGILNLDARFDPD